MLICKYVDGRTFRYNLNRKRHVIVIQDGMEMTKKKK